MIIDCNSTSRSASRWSFLAPFLVAQFAVTNDYQETRKAASSATKAADECGDSSHDKDDVDEDNYLRTIEAHERCNKSQLGADAVFCGSIGMPSSAKGAACTIASGPLTSSAGVVRLLNLSLSQRARQSMTLSLVSSRARERETEPESSTEERPRLSDSS